MYQDSKRTCTAIVQLIKPFVWWRSRCRCRRGFRKLPNNLFKNTTVSSRTQQSFLKSMSPLTKFLSQKQKRGKPPTFSKSKKAKMDEFVTITIRIGSLLCGVFKPMRSKSLPLKVEKHVSAEAIHVLNEALKKRSSYDRTFRNNKTCKLCFQMEAK